MTPSAKVFLTNSIGTSTTAGLIPLGNEYAPTAVLSTPIEGFNTVFSGLTLGPGSYFLVFENTGGGVGWVGFGQPAASVTLASGVNYGGSQALNPAAFAPAGTSGALFRANNYRVTGDLVSEVPEPSTLAPSLIAAALFLKRRR